MADLHDPDTLRSLSEETGPIGEWARLHLAIARRDGPLPTRPLYRGVLAVLRPPGFEAWFVDQLEEEGFICVLEHAVAHGVIPQDVRPWIDACRAGLSGPHAESCADALLRLGEDLSAPELSLACGAAPESATLPAWIASVDPASVREVAAQVDVVPAVGLFLQTALPLDTDPLRALEAGAAAVGRALPSGGRGSSRRRLARSLQRLAEDLQPPLAALIDGLCHADAPIPAWVAHGVARAAGSAGREPLERYELGVFDARALAAARDAGVPPLEGAVGIERGVLPAVPPSTIYGQQGLAARCPEWVPLLLSEVETREVGLELARFTPTEDVLEALFEQPVPSQDQARLDLAIALIHTGVGAVMPRVRQLAEVLDEANVAFLSAEALSFFREPL